MKSDLTNDQPKDDSPNLLAGLSLLTVIQIRNRGENIIIAARMAKNGKYEAAFLVPPYGRILVSTEPEFETEEAGKEHMRRVRDACHAYMAEQDAAK